jgi:predicted DNA-binding transcriptional regulator YafY
MTLAVSRPEWVIWWALQQGESVEILAPSDVRERVRKACDDLLRTYE